MKQFEFYLSISAKKYLDYYRGTVKQVVVRSNNGALVQFPASLLTKFVTKSGISGHFVLSCAANNKGAKLHKLSD